MLQHPPHNMQIKETCWIWIESEWLSKSTNENSLFVILNQHSCTNHCWPNRWIQLFFTYAFRSTCYKNKYSPCKRGFNKKQNIWFFLLTFCMSDFIFQMLSSSKKNKQKIGCYYFCISSQSTLLWVQVNITCLHRDMYTQHTVQISNPSV